MTGPDGSFCQDASVALASTRSGHLDASRRRPILVATTAAAKPTHASFHHAEPLTASPLGCIVLTFACKELQHSQKKRRKHENKEGGQRPKEA